VELPICLGDWGSMAISSSTACLTIQVSSISSFQHLVSVDPSSKTQDSNRIQKQLFLFFFVQKTGYQFQNDFFFEEKGAQLFHLRRLYNITYEG